MFLAASSLQRNAVTLRYGSYERGYYGFLKWRGGSRGWGRSLLGLGLGRRREFMVLALESSADDTCAAVVTSDKRILSNVVISQSAKLEEYGGISPYVAILEHQRKMPIAVRRALDEARRNLDLNPDNNNINTEGRNDELGILSRIDGIAYTRGPGMAGCLSVCANAAKNLAAALNKPIIGVHHMQAHALTPLLTSSPSSYSCPSSSFLYPPSPPTLNTEPPSFPFLTLLISGGHTLLLLALSHTKFKILATTVDEAVGRCIDKVARELGIGWKGRAPGAALEAFCRGGVGVEGVQGADVDGVGSGDLKMKIPFKDELKFSFSGLHSAVDRYILQHGTSTRVSPSSEIAQPTTGTRMETRNDNKSQSHHPRLLLSDLHKLTIARAFQNAAFKQLEEKVVLGLKWCAENRESILRNASSSSSTLSSATSGAAGASETRSKRLPVKHVVVSGGVASNMFFRQRLQTCLAKTFPNENLSLVFPPPSLCTDNAVMIAWASMHRFLAGESDDYSIDSKAKWSIEELDVS